MSNEPPVPVRTMTGAELRRRKAELEKILEVLWDYTYDDVCRELGEIRYLLGEDRDQVSGT